ncbi:multidrug effflux MFS transporter [Aquibacillus albus]|uniref:Bcr/CflA family efflux transporter n=1 Tax=Aquibacillus albus TaxID=1168171 RepID=A0ABS2MWM5_9BACI|nr:multidrug effflux MFS transporter [Aquibacillus albus]MBM7570173.1 DHA1 family bicyclomycin/chloramphenicol resistance-like MFS transporter [Aquibacillus albus]
MVNEYKQDRLGHSKLRIVILGFLIAFAPFTIDMYVPAFPLLTTDLNTSASMTQLSLTACLLGLAFGQIIVGSLSDTYGRKKPLIIAISIYLIASLLCALAPSIWVLIFLRFMQGAAGAGGVVIARSCVRDIYSGPQLTKVFAMLMLVMGTAPIIAPIIGGQLLHFFSWRGIFIALFMLGLIIMLSVIWGLPETLSIQHRSKGGLKNNLTIFKGLFVDRSFMGFAFIQGLVSGAMFAYIAGSSFVFQDIYNVTPQGYSLIFAVNAIGIITASQITGRLAGKVNEMTILKFGLLSATIGSITLLIVFLIGTSIEFVLIPLFFVVSSVGIVNPTCTSLAMQSKGNSAGSASALLGLLQYAFGGLVAPIVGIAGSQNVLPLGIVIAACEVLAITCYFMIVRLNYTVTYTEKLNL